MKPAARVERAVRNSSKTNDIVLDPFGGSGTTMIAAERLGTRARLIELDPHYVDVVVQRWQSFTGGVVALDENLPAAGHGGATAHYAGPHPGEAHAGEPPQLIH